MVQKVIFTKTADRTFNDIATFLEQNVSLSSAEKFADKVDSKCPSTFKCSIVLLVEH